MQKYVLHQRTMERLEGIREWLVDFVGTAKRCPREPSSFTKWQLYEVMKEGIPPEGVQFYLKLRHPEDFNNPAFNQLLSLSLRQAYEEYLSSGHFTNYKVPIVIVNQKKN